MYSNSIQSWTSILERDTVQSPTIAQHGYNGRQLRQTNMDRQVNQGGMATDHPRDTFQDVVFQLDIQPFES